MKQRTELPRNDTFLLVRRDSREPAIVVPGAIVVAGDADAPAVAEVVNLVEKPAGTIVYLGLLPGTFDHYEALIQRSALPA